MARDTASDKTYQKRLIHERAFNRPRHLRNFMRALLVFIDLVMLFVAFIVGYKAREFLPFFARPEGQPPLIDYIGTMTLHVVINLVVFYISRLYHLRRSFSRFDQFRSLVGTVTVGALLTSGIQELFFKGTFLEVDYPRSMFFYVWFLSLVFTSVGREVYQQLDRQLRQRGLNQDNLLIVGTGRIAHDITNRIQSRPELGYSIVGIVNDGHKTSGNILGIPFIGSYPQLPDLIDTYDVEQVIIALPDAKRGELVELITLCQRGQVDIKVYPDIFAYMAGDLNVDELGGTPLLTVRDIALRGWRLSLKRGLDIFGSFMGLVFLSPLMLLTAVLIRLESRGPIFYSQVRMGLDGRPFPMIKFRSMRADAEKSGPGWTTADDPRVTRVGKVLRGTNWDEIPQLINVLVGHMSLVGPRPERPVYVQQFREQIPRYMERHREKAGMTGWAQVNGLRGDTSIAERTSYDLWYVENWSLWLDIKIIARTVVQTILGRSPNAY